MFNVNDYNENVEYCEYVFRKNQELDLGLNNSFEIQVVANMYVEEIYDRIGDEVVEDDEVLLKVVDKYMRDIRVKEEYSYEPDLLIDTKLDYEKRLNARGGYSFNDDYDDQSMSDGPRRI